jgi:arylsulfatase A-like enzyme
MPPNLLLVVFDTARADAFEPYGAPEGSGPAFAQLARSGHAAPLAYSPSNWTLPAHASMFTGLLPGALGLTSGVKVGGRAGMGSRARLEANRGRVLAEALRGRGYRTAGISTNPWVHEVNGFDTGFDEFRSIRGGQRREPGAGIRSRLDWILDAWRARVDDGAAQAGRMLRRLMDERTGAPFFWFVNLMECHSPYLPPRPYNDLSGLERVRAASEAARYLSPQGMYRVCARELDVSDEALARMRHLYARSIRQMDDWLAGVLEELDRRGILADTLVVATSDHGENIGENHLIGHTLSMDERLIRVPFAWSGPGAQATPALMSLAELPRMVAGALGLDGHPWREELLPHGVAVSQIAGQVLLPERETLVRAWGIPEEAIRRIANPMTSATDGRHKLVREPGSPDVLYDLAADPMEVAPGDPASPDAPADLVARLRSAIDEVEAAAPAEPPAGEAAPDAEAAELEERLRTLGYI